MNRGRPRCFDEQTALEAAMKVFWEKGYSGASCEDLLGAMKLNAGSMYAAFGGKEELYFRALAEYTRQRFGKLLEMLADDTTPPLERIERMLGAVGNIMSQPDCNGCLVVNALDAAPGSQQAEMARQSLQQLQAALERTLKEARKAGQLRSALRPAELAALFVTMLQGLHLMGRARMGEKSIKGAVKSAVSLLHG